MGKLSEKHLLYGFLSAYILLQFFLLLFSESAYGYGGADNIAHYQIARYSFKYPELFLDLWGKPVYTALSAPFAQLGYGAAKTFNLVISVITLLISARAAHKLFPESSFFTVVFIAFTPVYFLLTISCLTEILFSFVLVAAVYLFLGKRFVLAAIVLSFIPMVRSEGVVILPVFAIALFLSRSYRFIPFLLTGTVLYSFIGYFVFGDILWLVNKLPYSMGESLYGSGSLFRFVNQSPSIFGIPLLLLIIAGLFIWGTGILKNFSLQKPNTILFILIAGSWIAYFAAHSYVWWKGTGGSLGLTRVMAGIVPLAVLTGMKFFEFVSQKIKSKYITYSIFSALAVFQIIMLFARHNLMLNADPTEQLIKKSTDYIRFNEEGEKVFYFNPLVIHYLGLDPYDTEQCNWWVADKQQPSNTLDWGDLLVWDAHFGPNEGGVQLENLENDPYLKEVKAFYPLEKITVLGGYDYSVQVFKKSETKDDTLTISDTYKRVQSFEDYIDERVLEVEGLKVWKLDSHQEYGPTIAIAPDVLVRYDILEASATLNYKTLEPIISDEVMLVFSVEHNGQSLRYEKTDVVSGGNNWEQLELNVKMPANIPASSKILVYIWNKDRKHLLMEKLTVELKSY
jgi:ABC-type cobalt transport system substrate-binding protein